MSLNNIQLDNQLLTELYRNALVDMGFNTDPKPAPSVKHLGNFAKNILLLVQNDKYPFLSDAELNFLTSILSACRLSLADVAIVNTYGLSMDELTGKIESLQPSKVLLFGMEPLQINLPMNFPAFQLQAFNNRMYLQSPTLEQLEKDKSLKQRLWTCLKSLFEIA